MHLYTKIFILNWVAALGLALFDKVFLNDAIEKTKAGCALFKRWGNLSLCVTLVWCVWVIVAS